MEILIVSSKTKRNTNSLICNLFLSQAKTAKQPSVARRVTTAEPQNTQQRNRKSAHFYFACIATTLANNEETCTVKKIDDSEQPSLNLKNH